MNLNRLLCPAVFAVIVSGLAAAPSLTAQRTPFAAPESADRRVPITLVLVNNGAPPTLLRRSSMEPRNVILLDAATADVQRLSDAVFSLLIMEIDDPEGRTRADNAAQRIRISPSRPPVYPWAGEALLRLKSEPRQAIGGFGNHHALQIWLAPLSPPKR